MNVKCLLVDDVPENLLALSALLRQDGVEILTARSGMQALDLLLTHEVALALLDVQMPEMDGFQLAELMRGSERTRHIPIIFVTAGSRDHYRLFKGYDSGAVDFLYKPVDARMLRNKADVFFRLHHQQQRLEQQLSERRQGPLLSARFLGQLDHDLRNPLNTIQLVAGGLTRASQEPAVQRFATSLDAAGRRLHSQLETLLDVLRLRFGEGLELHREAADFGLVLEQALRARRAADPAVQIEVHTQGALHGQWDVMRLEQMLAALLAPAGASAALRVEVQSDDSRLSLRLIRPGALSPQRAAGLFDPFADDEAPGSLAWYCAAQIAQAHGGSLHAQPAPDQTLILLELPRQPPVG